MFDAIHYIVMILGTLSIDNSMFLLSSLSNLINAKLVVLDDDIIFQKIHLLDTLDSGCFY